MRSARARYDRCSERLLITGSLDISFDSTPQSNSSSDSLHMRSRQITYSHNITYDDDICVSLTDRDKVSFAAAAAAAAAAAGWVLL